MHIYPIEERSRTEKSYSGVPSTPRNGEGGGGGGVGDDEGWILIYREVIWMAHEGLKPGAEAVAWSPGDNHFPREIGTGA